MKATNSGHIKRAERLAVVDYRGKHIWKKGYRKKMNCLGKKTYVNEFN